MPRAVYGPGSKECPACGRKTAFARQVSLTLDGPTLPLYRCNSCKTLSFKGEVAKRPREPSIKSVVAKAAMCQLRIKESEADRISRELSEIRKFIDDL